ncbi:DUF1361 domain-containing protein [Flavobacterium sp. N1994]|uniref:DUF1361 domain-containing protein n=1 Tax=Flavobacterium sp. N1994 TaxID=2986827 RepID=UPI002222F4A1|nr:DUF1361 domain-containing protein [Flavobacterium sp. N1994]
MDKILSVYLLDKKQNSILILLALLSLGLMLLRVKLTREIYLLFLLWNLFLAYIPYFLSSKIKTSIPGTLSFYFIGITWLLFLPNSFYLITDFVHLHHFNSYQYLFDILLLTSFTIAGFYAGILSLFDIHHLLQMKYSFKKSCFLIGVSIYLSAFGIYLGRILRFNSWDIIRHPFTLFYHSWKSIQNSETLLFTLVLGTLIFLIYGISYSFNNKKINWKIFNLFSHYLFWNWHFIPNRQSPIS